MITLYRAHDEEREKIQGKNVHKNVSLGMILKGEVRSTHFSYENLIYLAQVIEHKK